MGLPYDETNFDEIFYRWGIPEGGYLELPVVGPGNPARLDGLRARPARSTRPGTCCRWRRSNALLVLGGLDLVNDRYELDPVLDSLLYESADSYTAQRIELPAEHARAAEGRDRRRHAGGCLCRPMSADPPRPAPRARRRSPPLAAAGRPALAASTAQAAGAGDEARGGAACSSSTPGAARRRSTPASRASSRATPTCRRSRRACSARPGAARARRRSRRFVAAFQHYLSRRYGKQFREYRNARIDVTGARDGGKAGVLVQTRVVRPGQDDIAVDWQVSDRSGSARVVNLIIEGVSMLANERAEVGAMLDAQRGSIDGLIAQLNAA